MAENSKIEWTQHTFNPWWGCTKVHAGCTNCYAEKAMPNAMRKGGALKWGEPWQGGERVVASEDMWSKPLGWARKAAAAGERHRVFCASLADVLEVPAMPPPGMMGAGAAQVEVADVRAMLERARERLWDIIRKTAYVETGTVVGMPHWASYPGLDWLLLTKRPENWKLVPPDVRPLVWLGTSISDQKTADKWVPRLLAAEGFRYRFLSIEPLVGPVDFNKVPCGDGYCNPLMGGVGASSRRALDWAIVGGESGGGARPCSEEWVANIVRQCAEAGVACHVKQIGAVWADATGAMTTNDKGKPVKDHKGGDWKNWPEELRVRQYP